MTKVSKLLHDLLNGRVTVEKLRRSNHDQDDIDNAINIAIMRFGFLGDEMTEEYFSDRFGHLANEMKMPADAPILTWLEERGIIFYELEQEIFSGNHCPAVDEVLQ